MKTNKWMVLMLVGAMLIATPSWAQRRGGGGSRSASTPSRSVGGHSSSHSYSAPSRSYSAPSRSTSTPSRSYASPSRQQTTSRSYSAPSRTVEHSTGTAPSVSRPASSSTRRVEATTPRTPSTTVRGSAPTVRPATTPTPGTVRQPSSDTRTMTGGAVRFGGAPKGPVSGVHPGFAQPLHPRGPLPPSHRHIRPAPFFHHPIHHHYIHMHPIYWDPFLPPVVYWPGLWSFCVGYWAGSSCSNYTVVHEYVSNTHHVDMIGYAISGDLMYALVKDEGDTYLRVFDKADNLLAQHPVNKKYSTISIDSENGGCWIMKKNDKDPLLFLYSDGQLLIYEADE